MATKGAKLGRLALVLLLAAAPLVFGIPALATSQSSPANIVFTPAPNTAGSLAKYTVTFKTSASGALAVGHRINAFFPAGTGLPALASFNNNVTVNGVTTSAYAIDTSTRRVRVNTPVAIGANSNVTIVYGSTSAVITNPGAGTYTGALWTERDTTKTSSASYAIVAGGPPPPPPTTNAAPDAVDDATSLLRNSGANVIDVLYNDGDPDADPVTITSKTNGASGTVAIVGAGTELTYTPNTGFVGDDSFTYTIGDGQGHTDTATATVHVQTALTFDVCAKAGTLSLPGGATVPIWGFAMKPTSVPCTNASVVARLPGPLLSVPAGTAVTINLYNQLSHNVSLLFPGQNAPPDTTGTGTGTMRSYTFTATAPGTYLYESGAQADREVPMGLYGPLIVRPATGAYGTAASAYDIERLLVLSEIDTNLNNDPLGFDMRQHAPTYWLINGRAYPQIAALPAAAGKKVLLRYLNAGLVHHTMTLLGTHQRVIARDAYPLTFAFDAVAETLPTGQTLDTIATVPTGTASGKKLWLYERGLHITNVNSFPGGMLTSINVP